MNLDMPHKAIVNISFTIYPVMPTGELGQPIPRFKLNEKELQHKMVVISGDSFDECAEKLQFYLDMGYNCET